MPTRRSTSADLWAISIAEATPCAFIASVNCAPIDLTGLSAFMALCMTPERSFQRSAASRSSARPTMLVPLKVTLPAVMPAGGASSWAMAYSKVDLPQPDSPTIPMNSPAASSKLTSSTARTRPRSIAYSTVRPRTSSMGPACCHAAPRACSACALATDLRGLEEIPVAQGQRLRAQLPRAVGPFGQREHDDQDERAAVARVGRDHHKQREERYDQQHVGQQRAKDVTHAAEVGRGDPDHDGKGGCQNPHRQGDDQ